MSRINLSIDLTPGNTTIYREGKGIVLDEPNRVLCQNENDSVKVLAFGKEAVETQLGQFLVYPIDRNGIATNYVFYARMMLKDYVSRVIADKPNASVKASFLVSCGVTQNYKNHIKSLAFHCGIDEVIFVPYPLADLIGCGISFDDFLNCVIVDINYNNTDIAVLSSDGIVDAVSINFGTQNIDNAIYEQVRFRYGTNLSSDTINDIKNTLANLIQNGTMTLAFDGVDMHSNLPKSIKIASIDIYDAIKEYYKTIAQTILELVNRQTQEIKDALVIQGVIFCGRGSGVQNLNIYMEKRLSMPCFIASYDCTMFGLGKISSNKKLCKKLA